MCCSKFFVVLLSVFVVVGSVSADEVVFNNGDKLTGKVVKLVDGKLTLTSEVAGEVTVDMAKVATFSTDSPVAVHLTDGSILNKQIVKSEQNKLAMAGDNVTGAGQVDLVSVSSINPPPVVKPKWTGDVSLGYTATTGNSTTETVNASANISKRREKDRTQLSADYARGRQEDPDTGVMNTTENWLRTKAKYDYFFSKKFYGYVDGRYETDKIAELDRRTIVGVGVGYQWIESADMNFATEGGAAVLHEKYNNNTPSSRDLSAQLGYHFDKKLFLGLEFLNDLTFYPSTEDIQDYFLTTTAELRAPLSERLFANFKVIFDYDSTPAIGNTSKDTKYIMGVGMNF